MSGTAPRIPNVAVTGGIACGKSALGSFLSRLGACVLDADEVVHGLQRPGGPVARAVAAEFGEGFLDSSGAVDRARLAARVFADPEALARLNALSHPLVRDCLARWRETPVRAWVRAALIPLLFETGWEGDWDFTVCVACSEETQLARMRERGWSDAESQLRLSAQLPLAEKMRRSDYVLRNDGSLEDLAREAELLRRHLLRRFPETDIPQV